MRLALREADRATGSTYPNPAVGAVVVKDARVLASACSGPTGAAHAECRVLDVVQEQARGATLYVTLEPCCHFGRTPPCTRRIIESGITEVVVAIEDPDDRVAGKGIDELRRCGVRVRQGMMAEVAKTVHAHYIHHVQTRRPWVSLKAASSIDGRIACENGDSRWITGKFSRREAHRLRARHHAIGIGAATVLADNPTLTVRHVSGVDPQIVVFDSRLQLAGMMNLHQVNVLRHGTMVMHTERATAAARERISASGAYPVMVDTDAKGHVDLDHALKVLAAGDIRSILVEGGGHLLDAFLTQTDWQEFHLFSSPVVLGGRAKALFPNIYFARVSEALRMSLRSLRRRGHDIHAVFEPISRTSS